MLTNLPTPCLKRGESERHRSLRHLRRGCHAGGAVDSVEDAVKNDNLNYEPFMLVLVILGYAGWVLTIGLLTWWLVK